jgi:hypothetical protein
MVARTASICCRWCGWCWIIHCRRWSCVIIPRCNITRNVTVRREVIIWMFTTQLWVTQVEVFRKMRSFHLRFSLPREHNIPLLCYFFVSTQLNHSTSLSHLTLILYFLRIWLFPSSSCWFVVATNDENISSKLAYVLCYVLINYFPPYYFRLLMLDYGGLPQCSHSNSITQIKMLIRDQTKDVN